MTGWWIDAKTDTQLPDGRTAVKAEGVMQASPEEVWKHLIRFNDYSKFMPRVLESFFISSSGVEALKSAPTRNASRIRALALPYRTNVKPVSGQKWEGDVFMVLDTPFPVENRWYVIHVIQDETKAAEKTYRRCWDLVTGNIDAAHGCWNLSPSAEPAGTLARYEDSINPGGNVPDWAAKMGSRQTIPDVFRSLEKRSKGTSDR